MIYVSYDDNNDVQFMHYLPFDAECGLGQTEEELLKTGALVDEIPDVECPSNKGLKYKYDKINNKVTVEFIDRILSEKELLQQQVDDLTVAVANIMGGVL